MGRNLLKTNTAFQTSSSRPIPSQNAATCKTHPMRLPSFLLGFTLMLPATVEAQIKQVPFPTREELRALQLLAYNCSRGNDAESCDKTRSLADPLMDHPRLSAACKDTVWEVVQTARVASSNSFQRRDSIDRPARRLTLVCSEPEKPQEPAAPTQT